MAKGPEAGIERSLTDSGATGDKIGAADPAAVPVHTDSEASGHPTPRGAVICSVGRLVCQALRTPPPDTFGAWRQPRDRHQRQLLRTGLAWTAALSLLGIALGIVGLM